MIVVNGQFWEVGKKVGKKGLDKLLDMGFKP